MNVLRCAVWDLGRRYFLWNDLDSRKWTWNRKLGRCCRSGSLETVVRELAKCKLDVVKVKVIRWDKGGDYTFFSLEM